MRRLTMIVQKKYITQLGLTALQQINGEIAKGQLKIERIVSMQETMIDDRIQAIILFYAV